MAKRVGIYTRVSTVEQGIEGKTSIEKQTEACRKQMDVMASFDEMEERKLYEDRGASGDSRMHERPEGDRLMKDVRRGKLDVIIVYSMDRFTRTARKGLEDFDLLERSGVHVVFVKEQIDTGTPAGRLFRTMLAAFAEFEREQIRDRTMAASYARAKKGIWPGGMPPYGYTIDPDTGKLVKEEHEALTVTLIYKLANEGSSHREIARTLNETGYPTRRGGTWEHKQVGRILSDDRYLGKVVRQYANAGGAEPEPFTYHAPRIVPQRLAEGVWAKKSSG